MNATVRQTGPGEIEKSFGRFNAKEVAVLCPDADVIITTYDYDGTGFEVTVTGSVRAANLVKVEQVGEVLTVSGSRWATFRMRLSAPGTRLSYWLHKLRWLLWPLDVLGIRIAENFGKVLIRVPAGTPVRAVVDFGNVSVGDTHAALTADLTGNGDLTAGHVGEADLCTRRTGNINVQLVDGDARISRRGIGEINVDIVAGSRIEI